MAVGLIVGGWLASAVIGKLITMAFSYIGDQYKWQTGMKDELKRLEKALPKIQAVVGAAEHGHIKDSTGNLEAWLWQLKDAADEADDVLDEMEYLHLEEQVKAGKNNKVRDTASHLKKIMKRAVKRDPTLKRLKEAVNKLDGAAADVGVYLALVDHSVAKQQQQQQFEITSNRKTSSVLSTATGQVFGRNKERDEIVKQLLITKPGSAKTNLPVILISGMGGVGKTTLAQYVFHDESVKNHFELRIWICVSDVFDVYMLTKKILESVTRETPRVTSFEMLQEDLMEALMSKRFLLVLDDVWNDKDWASWEKLFAPLRHGHKESKIVVTTRMTTVAKVIEGTTETFALKGLSDDDCWLLLGERAFGDEDPDNYPELESIGYQIAQKLKGLPLAAKSLGGLLRSNLDDGHWRRILESDILDLEQGKGDIMAVLRLSYDHLPAHLQSCFAYCSIFPQDHEFDKDDLIRMWAAAGLIQHAPIVNETPEDIGAKYFDDLCNRSFFELQDQGYGDYCYLMHDHLHDLARLVSVGECLRLPLGADSKDISHSVRHLSVTINCNDPGVLEKVCKAKNLRTLHLYLIGVDIETGPALRKLLKELKSIRLLKLYTLHNIKVPDTIGDSIHLRYLNLEEASIFLLPKSLCRLYHLQYVALPKYIDLFLPEGSSNLINLRCVAASREYNVSAIAYFGKLTRLQQLEQFNVRRQDGYRIEELKDTKELRKLGIQNLENVISYEEACEANLKDKKFLNTLQLEWGAGLATASTGSPEMDEKVFDGLQPHSNLKELTIFKYEGARSPSWMEANILSNLKHLYLRRCDGWEHLPPLGQLPFLKVLHFSEMHAIKQIGADLYGGGDDVVFPSLEELVFEDMSQMIDWSIQVDGRLWFPRLRLLRVKRCPELTRWPTTLPPSLTELDIYYAGLTTLPACLRGCNEAGMSRSKITIWTQSSLSCLSIGSCTYLESVAEGLLQHKFLKHLKIEDCSEVQALVTHPGHLPLFPSLQTLCLSSCGELEMSLPTLLQGASYLHKLELFSCMHMTSLPLGGLGALRELVIAHCPELVSLEGFQELVSLESLDISGCHKLATRDTVQGFAPPLISLRIDYSSLQPMLPVLTGAASLTKVHIVECSELTSFPAQVQQWLLQIRHSLQELTLCNADSLQLKRSLPTDIQRLTKYWDYNGGLENSELRIGLLLDREGGSRAG